MDCFEHHLCLTYDQSWCEAFDEYINRNWVQLRKTVFVSTELFSCSYSDKSKTLIPSNFFCCLRIKGMSF